MIFRFLGTMPIALQIVSEFEGADVVYVMDSSNYQLLRKRFYNNSKKIYMLLNHDVADPWYSGDFEKTYQEITEGCTKIINGLEKKLWCFLFTVLNNGNTIKKY